jgi:pilus assembly protein CpaE
MSRIEQPVACALISADPAFREMALGMARGPDAALTAATVIDVPFAQIRDAQVQALRKAAAEVVLLDLEDDPATGVRFAQFLADARPGQPFVAVGPVLAPDLLIAAMSAGISEYLPKPVTEEALVAALLRLRRRFGGKEAPARTPGQVLAAFSAKGGSGCTTVAANLAIQLHKLTAKKVLLLDLELELGELAVHLGMQPRFNFVDLVRNFHRVDAELLASYIEAHDSGVHLLSAPLQPERPEAVTGEQIRSILGFLRQHYDYVVVDTARTFSPATTAALEEAEQVFLVATVDLPTLRNIKRCLPLLDRITGHASEKVKLVVNRYQETDVITLAEVERTLGLQVHRTLANDYEAVSRSINAGKPVVLNGASAFGRDLGALSAGVAGIAPPDARPRFGPLAKLFGRKQEKIHG